MESLLLDQMAALSHPHRLALFRLLVRRYPDAVAAGELATALDVKPSTMSVYLAALTRAGLIEKTRRGTSLMYALARDGAERMMQSLFLDCCRGRADLHLPSFGAEAKPKRRYNVLFLCSGNSARSILAEAVLRHEAGARCNAFSAGTDPRSEVNRHALDLLEARGFDVSALRTQPVADYQSAEAPRMDFVFTVCDRAANADGPAWAGQPLTAHWGLPDPSVVTGTDAEQRLAFHETFGALTHRIRAFTALPFDALDRLSLQARLDDIARMATAPNVPRVKDER